ncbi:MAG: hypothetical protein AB8U69_01330 [Anaplasma ovis]|nr:hypothetical protein [Anaplasma ovis]ASI47862.1 hypothetical protein AOV_03455 [Anaplasma ovis str. Haibei]
MSGEDEYKEIIRQCIGSVKEVFGEGRFDDVVASIMKMQEKVLASSMKDGDPVGQIAADGVGSGLYDRIADRLEERVSQRISEDLRIIKKRLLRLERVVLGGNAAPGDAAAQVSGSQPSQQNSSAAAEGG